MLASFVLAATLAGSVLADDAHYSSGVGRFPTDSLLKFSPDSFTRGIKAITDTLFSYPNRTIDQAVPVKKIYGVNVRIQERIHWATLNDTILDRKLALDGTMDV